MLSVPDSGDGAEKFEELRCPDDRVGDACLLDRLFLGQLGAKIATILQAVGADDREGDVMTDGGLSLRACEIAARVLEEGKGRCSLERRRV